MMTSVRRHFMAHSLGWAIYVFVCSARPVLFDCRLIGQSNKRAQREYKGGREGAADATSTVATSGAGKSFPIKLARYAAIDC